MSTLVDAFDNPPSAPMGADEPTSTTSTSPLTHYIPPEHLPNRVVNRPNLAQDLVAWARQYLQSIHHQPSNALHGLRIAFPSEFADSHLGSKGMVANFYSRVVETYSQVFVRDAEQLGGGIVHFAQCASANGAVSSRWEWRMHGENRMVVEHKGRQVFDNFCNTIRGLATANNGTGSALGLDANNHATGAKLILLKLGRQMIADNCQLGMLFGGHRFILFAIYDLNVNDAVHHRMLCSRIHWTRGTNGFAGVIQVTIAALLAAKDTFLHYKKLPIGIKAGQGGAKHGSKAASKGSSRTKGKAATGSSQSMETRPSVSPLFQVFTGWNAHIIQRVRMSYSADRARHCYIFYRVDMDGSEDTGEASLSHHPKSTADIILYEPIGSGCSGTVFEADLNLADRESWPVAAKFFDPQHLPKECDTQKMMFDNEAMVYEHVADASMCLPFYGAFYGKGFTGRETYLVILGMLSSTFDEYPDMTQRQREIAFDYVLKLHQRGVHHGDVEPRNFGLKAKETGNHSEHDEDALVIYDFSHASGFTEECDPEECFDIQQARREIIEGVNDCTPECW